MSRSILSATVLAVVLAGGLTARAEDGDVQIGSAAEFAAMKVIVDDDSLELRATGGNEADVRRRADYFKASIARWRKAYADRGFVTLPKMQVGIFDDHPNAMRAETVHHDLIFINGGLLKEPELELDSTLCHECFHAVQKGSAKGMEASNELFTKWPDESTASWMQYTLCPDSDLVKQRSADLEPADFEGPFFRLNSIHHPYRCFDFWVFLDELYGAQDLIQAIYINPEKVKSPPAPVEDHVVLLENLLKTRPDKKGRVRSLADVFVDYVLRTYWKKDREPLVSTFAGKYKDRLVKNLGKPGELKPGTNGRIAQEIPYVDGKDRKRKKTFETVEAEIFGIAKQYEITSAMKSDEKGALKVSLSGPKGMGRVVVFPKNKDGLSDPVIGEVGQPARLEGWESLSGAIVLLVDVGSDQRHQFKVTVEVTTEIDWQLSAKQSPTGFNSAFHLQIRMDPKRTLTDEESNQLEGRWFAATIELDDRLLYSYGLFQKGVGYIGSPYLFVKQGDHAWRITAFIGEKPAVLDGASKIEITGESLKTAQGSLELFRDSIKDYEAKLADPQEKDKKKIQTWLGGSHASLAGSLYSWGDLEEATKEIDKALDLCPDTDLHFNKLRGDLCLAAGDIERYLLFCEKAKMEYDTSAHYQFASQAFITFRNDLKSAWKYQSKHEEQYKAAGKPVPRNFPMFPKLDEEVLK